MSGGSSSEEKTLPPSAKKLREARRKGQIARSREMVTAVVVIAAVGYLFARAGSVFNGLAEVAEAAGMATGAPFPDAVGRLAGVLGRQVAWTVGPFIGVLAAATVITSVAVNGGMIAALDPVTPKMERLNPVEGFKRLFALRSLVELVKSVLKIALVAVTACLLIAFSLQAVMEQPSCGLGCAGPLLRGLLKPLLIASGLLFLVIGMLDIGVQRWLFLRDMRMTKSEQKREHKEMEGDPLIKGQHRREQRSGLQATARTGLRNATFIVRSADLVLAFRFAKPDAMVPVLVARGKDDGALALLEEARSARIPVVPDAAAVAALSGMKVGRMVDKEDFAIVIACMREAGVM